MPDVFNKDTTDTDLVLNVVCQTIVESSTALCNNEINGNIMEIVTLSRLLPRV